MPQQLSILNLPPVPRFDGPGLTDADHTKLHADLARVLAVLRDGQPHLLSELSVVTRIDRGSIGSRVRDLRKFRHGGHDIRREPTGVPRLWAYRLVSPVPAGEE